jgi:cell shape-determining protein MreC
MKVIKLDKYIFILLIVLLILSCIVNTQNKGILNDSIKLQELTINKLETRVNVLQSIYISHTKYFNNYEELKISNKKYIEQLEKKNEELEIDYINLKSHYLEVIDD